MTRACLLYQNGMANVFAMDDKPRRLLQHAFSPCEWFVNGLIACGVKVEIMHCDKAGDAAGLVADWQPGPGGVFAGGNRPPAAS